MCYMAESEQIASYGVATWSNRSEVRFMSLTAVSHTFRPYLEHSVVSGRVECVVRVSKIESAAVQPYRLQPQSQRRILTHLVE